MYASIVGGEVIGARFTGTAAGRIPIYPFPEEIGHVLAKVSRYAAWRRTPVGTFPTFFQAFA